MNQWSGGVLAAVTNSLWPVMALVLGTWLALRFARQFNAATRHLVWWGVLGAIVVLPAAPGLLTIEHPVPATVTSETHPLRTLAPEAAAPEEPVPSQSTGAAAVRTGGVSVHAGAWPERIFTFWLALFLLQVGRIVSSYAYLRQIRRRAVQATPEIRHSFDTWMLACGVHRPARLFVSGDIVSPMAIGFRSPTVMVPEALCADFSASELDHVLLHELAHLARRDDWTNLACRFLWALLALHPAAALALRQIEREREIACDDWVVAATGEARPYAASLARLFEVCFNRRRALLASGMVGRGSQLGDRIAMLLRRQREFTPRASATRLAVWMVLLLGFLAAAAQAPVWIVLAQDAPRKPVPAAKASPAASAASAPSTFGAKTSFLAALVAAGYGNLPVDDIIAMKNSGITAEFLNGVQASNWGTLSPREMIDLRSHGVTPQYLSAIHATGLRGLSVQDIIDLRNNGVDPVWVQEIESAGLGSYTTAQLIDFRRNGVSAELLHALKDAHFHNVEPREIIQLRQNGVGRRSLEEAGQYGPSLTISQIIRLKQAGVI